MPAGLGYHHAGTQNGMERGPQRPLLSLRQDVHSDARRVNLGAVRRERDMVFTKRLREGVRRGTIASSIRIWKSPHVRVGRRYRMEEGEIEVDSIEQIAVQDITH